MATSEKRLWPNPPSLNQGIVVSLAILAGLSCLIAQHIDQLSVGYYQWKTHIIIIIKVKGYYLFVILLSIRQS
jgi:hypothetical protein